MIPRPITEPAAGPHRRTLLRVAAAAASTAHPAGATERWPPARPVRIIVSVAPGGTLDTLARILAHAFTARLGGAFAAENRSGANGNLAYEAVARAAPDGTTLLLAPDSITSNPSLVRDVAYDPIRDFAPIALVARIPLLLVVRTASPLADVAALIDRTRADPGTLTMAVAGIGSSGHVVSEMLLRETGGAWTFVPYRGGATPLNDLIAGTVDASLVTLAAALPMVRQGRLRALAVTTALPSRALLDVPTLAATVAPGFDVGNWQGLFAPAGTLPPVVEALATGVDVTLADAPIRARLEELGFDPVGGGPGPLRDLVADSVPRWRRVFGQIGLRQD